MKILIYGNRKQDDDIWDISTPELAEAAYRELFKTLDEYWQVYADLDDEENEEVVPLCEPCGKNLHRLCEDKKECPCVSEDCPAFKRRNGYEQSLKNRQKDLYRKAKAGDYAAMKKLMDSRTSYEYEEFRISEARKA